MHPDTPHDARVGDWRTRPRKAPAVTGFLIALFVTILLVVFRRYLRIEDVVSRA